MYIVFALLAFSILIIVHELGHFVVAKLNGIYVEEFSIGMGPKIFGIKGKETEYNLRILPFGGFVRMLGENEEVNNSKAFSSKTPIQKILVVGAGAFMNYVLAIVIFAAFAMNFGFAEPKIAAVDEGSPAQQADLQVGDEFVKVNGKRIFTSDDLKMGINLAKGEPITLEVKRGNEKIVKELTPFIDENSMLRIGITNTFVEKPSFIEGVKHSFKESLTMINQTFSAYKSIFTGEANLKTDVGGPITIIKMSAEMAKVGIWNLMWFIAFLSVQLAVLNLIPFPALDGGIIAIQLIEMITRKKIPERYIEKINTIGFTLLMILMVVVLAKDIIFPIL